MKDINEKYDEYVKFCLQQKTDYDEYLQKLQDIRNKRHEKLVEIIDLTGKYIFIKEDNRYMAVDEVFKHGDKIIIRGYGFYHEITNYQDACDALL